jgi:phosphohistidine swiveling domain-containing protein
MAGLQDVSHMKMQRDLVQLVKVARRTGTGSAEWNGALSDFLARNYFHGDAELDISTPRWGERPERVRQIVEDILRSGIDPKDPADAGPAQSAVFEAEQDRVMKALRRSPWKRLRFERAFRKRLRLARAYLSRREEMREYSTRAYNVVRRFALEAGERLRRRGYLHDVEDVFMLTTSELARLDWLVQAPAEMRSATRLRRLLHEGYRRLDPPGELGRNVTQVQAGYAPYSGGLVLNGIGCSAGVVKGCVRVVPTLEQADSLRPAEILVTKFTDPGWTPVLGLVSGIVTEVGGLLSHAAVIGREYGIPAVLNVPGATQLLKTGQLVEVDGSRGTVRLVDDDGDC